MELTYSRCKMSGEGKLRGVINTSDLYIHQKIRYIPVKPDKKRERMRKINKSKGYENVLYRTIKFPIGKVFGNIKNFYFILKYFDMHHMFVYRFVF